MNFSADDAARKWSSRARAGRKAAVPALAAALALMFAHSALARSSIPLPRPRPPEAPKIEGPAKPDELAPADTPKEDAEAVSPKPPEPSACRLALTDAIAIAPSVPPIRGPGACGGEDLVKLEAVVISQTERIAVKPAAILRCTMATAIADWVRADMVPLAADLGTKLSELDNFDSYECRGRNRIKGAKLSEHGLANALDVRGLKLANGNTLSLTDRNVPRDTREKVLASVCARFMTVLGPGSDWYHEDHIHLDLAERRNNYRICQWGVYDPLPEIAPLLPAERPEDAPPRLTAEQKAEQDKASAASAEPQAADIPEEIEAESPKPAASDKPAKMRSRK